MSDFIKQLKAIVGDAYVATEGEALAPFIHEYTGRYQGKALAAVRPATTEDVSKIVTLCAKHKVPVVPQGGNTGLVGGSVPYDDKTLVINLSRMNKIRVLDAANFSMTVDAGCILQQLQMAARNEKLFLPLSLGAEGTCQIGGNIASNAGGILTIRYGNARDLVLGLEVVLPDGQIWNGLRSLRKDNTGYALKHLFIGAEGTLGIITGAVLKLYPEPQARETFVAALNDPKDVVSLLGVLRSAFGESIQAYEMFSRSSVEAATAYQPRAKAPLAHPAPWYVLCEITGAGTGLRVHVEDALAQAFEKNLITDATIAQSEQQRADFWVLRESLSGGAQNRPGGCIKHDVAVPVARIPDFIRDADHVVAGMIPDAVPSIFGHAGDGNLHYDVTCLDASKRDAFLARWDEVLHKVHEVVDTYEGSISAEHGVGAFKVKELTQHKAPVEMELMRTLKKALDPHNLMNPGKVLA